MLKPAANKHLAKNKAEKFLSLLRNYHLWIIVSISFLLFFIYQAWPWREWQFSDGVLQFVPWLSALYPLAMFENSNHIIGLLFFMPIFYAMILMSWEITLFTTIIVIAGVLPIIINMWSPISIFANLLVLLAPLLIILIITIEFNRRRQARQYLSEREKERTIYLSKIIETEEKERKLVSQDLHDDIIQLLTVITFDLDRILSNDLSQTTSLKSNIESIKEMTSEAIENTRRLCKQLRPSILDNMGLVPALRWLVETMNDQTSINTIITFKGMERRLAANTETIVFRILQEALFNIRKHSRAKNASITFDFGEYVIQAIIEDDGQGFDILPRLETLATYGKLGLLGIKQRVTSINGKLDISSKPGQGTKLFIEIKC
jgi:two-component system, NarL family, sensor histidine kinase DegS